MAEHENWYTKGEAPLYEELKKHGVSDYMPFNILYIAENVLSNLDILDGFTPQSRYLRYLAQELLIEGVPDSWNDDDMFRLIRSGNEKERRHAARRVLSDWRCRKDNKAIPTWRGRIEGDEATFG